jgi:hypothetical protein
MNGNLLTKWIIIRVDLGEKILNKNNQSNCDLSQV